MAAALVSVSVALRCQLPESISSCTTVFAAGSHCHGVPGNGGQIGPTGRNQDSDTALFPAGLCTSPDGIKINRSPSAHHPTVHTLLHTPYCTPYCTHYCTHPTAHTLPLTHLEQEITGDAIIQVQNQATVGPTLGPRLGEVKEISTECEASGKPLKSADPAEGLGTTSAN